jgi:predicted Zn-dependent protease
MALYLERRHAESIRVFEESAARWPTQSYTWAMIAAGYAQLGDAAEARRAAERAHRLQPVFDLDLFGSRLRDPAQRDYLREGLVRAGI